MGKIGCYILGDFLTREIGYTLALNMRYQKRNRSLLLSFFLILSGCLSLSEREQREHIISPSPITNTRQEALDSGFFTEGNWPEKKWWESFEEITLNALMEEALLSNPTLQAVHERIESAKQSAIVVRSKLFPLIFFNAEDNWNYLSQHGLYRTLNPNIPLNANLIDLTLSFTYEFDFWSKNRNLFQAALGKVKTQEAEEAQTKLVVTTALAQAYYALTTNLTRKKLYEELVILRRAVSSLQNLLQLNALRSRLEPLLSEEEEFQAEKLLLSVNEEIAANKHLINMLRGKGPDEPLDVENTLPDFPVTLSLPNEISINLLSRRPDLMAQIWKLQTFAHEVGAAKADFLPNINLVGSGGIETVLASFLFSPSSLTANVHPAINLPIFTAGAIKANVREKKAFFDQAVYEYNQLILQSAQEVTDYIVLIESVFAQKKKQEKIVKDATERFEITFLRYLKGLGGYLENYAYQIQVVEKKLEDLQLTYMQYLSAIKLIKALGGGYSSTLPLDLEKPLKPKEKVSW